jgi:hypothetical protein
MWWVYLLIGLAGFAVGAVFAYVAVLAWIAKGIRF